MVWSITAILALGSLLLSLLVASIHSYWWQVKEYRLDRMVTWFRYNRGWREFLRLTVRRPTLTLRSLIILFLGFGSSVIGGFTLWKTSWVLTLPLWGLIGVWFGVAVSAPLVWWLTERTLKQAAAKVLRIKPTVVAITGSIGKSSAKEFLSELLAESFTTVKTLKSENTPLGVARRILMSLKNDTKILIVEMGAYRKGEIQVLCRMVPPDIAWITGLGSQHLGLFGSEDAIAQAKYEVVEGLKPKGLAVIRAGALEEKLITQAKEEGRSLLTYGVLPTKAEDQATVADVTPKGFELRFAVDGQPIAAHVNLRGAHFAENLVGASLIAFYLGVNRDVLVKRLSRLEQPAKSLAVIRLKNGGRLLLNRFNTSVEGFVASVEYLKLFSGKKYILTPGIIELGKETQHLHQWLGRKLRQVETVFVTNTLHASYLKTGGINVVAEENSQKMAVLVGQTLKRGATLLVEGRISEDLYKRLLTL